MQVDKIVYFALLLKKCVRTREPSSDLMVVQRFEKALSSFRKMHGTGKRYRQNKRSIQYILIMARELGLIFRNNKLTPWGRTLQFFTPTDRIPTELPFEFKIFFLSCFLLENYAMAKSFHDHLEEFGEIRDDHIWYEKIEKRPRNELANNAFSVYLHALRIALESVHSLADRRRYLKLHREATRRGKTAKALYPKIKPSLGMIDDLGLIDKERVENRICFSKRDSTKPYCQILESLPNYKTIVSQAQKDLLYTLLVSYGYKGTKNLTPPETIEHVENLYKQLCDPVFNVSDINTLISILVIEKVMQDYRLTESEVRETIFAARESDRHRFQILPDRYGRKRFLRIEL